MRRRFAVVLGAAFVASSATALFPSAARADEKTQCIAASDQGQSLRDDGKYRRARDAFQTCARDACPALVRSDCVRWLSDLENASPSVVVSAKDDKGADLVDVKVLVDGTVLETRLDGRPALVDPGDHVFRYETASYPPVEEHVLVHAGEKGRVLSVQFGTPAAGAGVGATASGAAAGGDGAPAGARGGSLTSAVVFGGIAVVAFASEAYFGLTGLSQRSKDLGSGGCAPTCSNDEKTSIQTKFTVADISLGVGLVSTALAVYMFIASRGGASEAPAAQSAHLEVAPVPGGGAAMLGGRF